MTRRSLLINAAIAAGALVAGERTTSSAQLIAGPLDPGPHPDRTIAAVPAEELRAWCPPCWGEAVKVARRQDREAERIARWNGQMAALFDPAT